MLLARLAPLGPLSVGAGRIHFHGAGHYPLGEMVREWVKHDLSHRRQLALRARGDRVTQRARAARVCASRAGDGRGGRGRDGARGARMRSAARS